MQSNMLPITATLDQTCMTLQLAAQPQSLETLNPAKCKLGTMDSRQAGEEGGSHTRLPFTTSIFLAEGESLGNAS